MVFFSESNYAVEGSVDGGMGVVPVGPAEEYGNERNDDLVRFSLHPPNLFSTTLFRQKLSIKSTGRGK